MFLQFHIVTGTLTKVDDEQHIPSLTVEKESEVFHVPCSARLIGQLKLKTFIGTPVIITVVLNADGTFIDTSTILFNSADKPRIILPGQ